MHQNQVSVVRATAAQLRGDAADSPIVVEKNQNLYALFFGYRF
jgi:outer membrane scaffolding protein for murein synthesis (MipA/OmpV family)